MLLRGCFRILFLYDVAEAIDVEKLLDLLGTRGGPVRRVFPRRTPEYVRFEPPPIVEPAQPIALATGEAVLCSIKYYAFAVVVVQFEVPFGCDWQTLLAQTARWADTTEMEPYARDLLHEHMERVSSAVIKPNTDWLNETYLLVNLEGIGPDGNGQPTATELLSEHEQEIAQLIRGEVTPLSNRISENLAEASLSYYTTDLVAIGPAAALVYDRSEDAAATNLVLEYAKMQLLLSSAITMV